MAAAAATVAWRLGAFGKSAASLANSPEVEDRRAAIETLAKSRGSSAS